MGVYEHGAGVVELPLIDFAPDLAYDAGAGGKGLVLLDCDNAQPTMKGYQALNSLLPFAEPGVTPSGTPAPESVMGSTLAYFSNAQAKVYFGGTNHIYRLDGDSWIQVSPAFSTTATWRWRFGQFGDQVLAVNPIVPESYVATGSTGAFTVLDGSPPLNPTTLVSVNGQVLMFAGANWYASALETYNNWVPDIQTQAGTGPLYDFPGSVVAAAPIFRSVVVFKETATWLGGYVGAQAVWSWQLISSLTGTWCQESVIVMPESIAFLGADDFYVTSGYTPQRIPNSLKEWFFDLADPTQFLAMLSRYDANHGIAYWYFVSRTPPVAGVPDRWVAWNSRNGRWSTGYTRGAGAFSIPAPNQQPGALTGLYFGADQVLYSWTGAPGAMRLSTSYYGSPNALSQVMRVKPIYYVAPLSATVMPFHVRNLGDADLSGGTTFLNRSDGWYYFRQYDRWHRFSIQTEGPAVVPTVLSQTGAEVSAIALDLRAGGWR